MNGDWGRPKAALKLAGLLLLLISTYTFAVNPGIIHVNSEKGGDYCFLFPSKWATLSDEDNASWLDLELPTRNLTYSAMCCLPSFLGEVDSDGGGLSTRIASVREGNCNLYENAKLQEINGTQGLLTLGGDAPPFTADKRSRSHWGHCEEMTLPGVLLSDEEILYLLFKNLLRDLLYKAGGIYLLSMAIVTIGSYWAGSTERRKKQYLESQYQREDNFGDITIDNYVHFTCTCTVMAAFMLLALYCFYDYLAHVLTGIFCLYASFSLYSCLTPLVNRLPFGERVFGVPYFHTHLEIRRLLLAVLCLSVNTAWVIFRKDDQWSWVVQDVLGISIGVYILRTVHMPTLQACSWFLFAHLLTDALGALLTPFLTKIGRGGTDLASPDMEEIPFLLKVPTISSISDLEGGSFTALSLGDIVLPGLLVAYCHRFDVQVESSGIYFLASTLAYSYGLLAMLMVATFLKVRQSTLPYLVPLILVTSLAVATCRKEVIIFWTGVGSAGDTSQPSTSRRVRYADTLTASETQLHQQGEKQINILLDEEDFDNFGMCREEQSEPKTHSEEVTN
ncbi:signal peptide peptidase-like 2B [Paroedura picta]|uniref:signal peptide peptidase-like 2B n=1 Tax=Paroedura picta TaxID=143630 RepID=UPI00405628B7